VQQIDQMRYRLRLAEGFLAEARQDKASQSWRSCVDNSQLAVENAAKVFLAFLGPVGRTHNPGMLLEQALQEGKFPEERHSAVQRVAQCARTLGPKVHAETDYGDEEAGRTPWELFDESSAKEALQVAEEAVSLARSFVEGEKS